MTRSMVRSIAPSPCDEHGGAAVLPWCEATPVTGDPGKAEEFEEFYADHHRELARLAYLVVGDHAAADDITADALLAVWKQWDRVVASEYPVAYVRRAVVNIATSSVRRRVRERRGLVALMTSPDPPTAASDQAAIMDVRTALLALPPGRRACVILRHALGLSVEEVAETMQIRVGTVKSQTSKGVAQLREQLGAALDTTDGSIVVVDRRPPR